MSANGISKLEFKRSRQIAKLQLASIKRESTNRRFILNISQLPTLYGENSNDPSDIIDNANEGGLVIGRPWVATFTAPDAFGVADWGISVEGAIT